MIGSGNRKTRKKSSKCTLLTDIILLYIVLFAELGPRSSVLNVASASTGISDSVRNSALPLSILTLRSTLKRSSGADKSSALISLIRVKKNQRIQTAFPRVVEKGLSPTKRRETRSLK